MSNTTLKCHSLITSITINGNVYVPDGNNRIAIPSADASKILYGTQMPGQNSGPIVMFSPPTDPTT